MGCSVWAAAAFALRAQAQNLFVTDWTPGLLYEYTPSGVQTLIASLPGQGDTGLAFNNVGALFVADERNGDIYEIAPNGQQSVFASGLVFPGGLAFNSAGNLFVNNGENIDELTPSGAESTFATGTTAAFVLGLAFNSAGDLFAADWSSGDIYEFTPNGQQSIFLCFRDQTVCAGF